MPKDGKPRGRMSSYAFFVQICREEHKKTHPGESVVFADFSRKCAEKWKTMVVKEKKRFEDMADKDKLRFNEEMNVFEPNKVGKNGKRKRTKDPNAPKRSLSGFFFFCHEERGKVRAIHPGYGVGDIAKELGKRWEICPNRPKFEALAAQDKQRYELEKAEYQSGGKKAKVAISLPPLLLPPVLSMPVLIVQQHEEEEEEDDDEDEENDESD